MKIKEPGHEIDDIRQLSPGDVFKYSNGTYLIIGNREEKQYKRSVIRLEDNMLYQFDIRYKTKVSKRNAEIHIS